MVKEIILMIGGESKAPPQLDLVSTCRHVFFSRTGKIKIKKLVDGFYLCEECWEIYERLFKIYQADGQIPVEKLVIRKK